MNPKINKNIVKHRKKLTKIKNQQINETQQKGKKKHKK